jgi:hypothetical protein
MQEGLRMEIGEGRQHTISGGSAHNDEITDTLPEAVFSTTGAADRHLFCISTSPQVGSTLTWVYACRIDDITRVKGLAVVRGHERILGLCSGVSCGDYG